MTTSPATPIAFAGTISRGEFLRVQRLLLPWWARPLPLTSMSGAAVCFFINPLNTGWAWNVVLVVAYTALLTWWTRRVPVRGWKEHVRVAGGVHGSIGPQGIAWNTEQTQSRFEWAKILRVKQAKDLTLAIYSPRCAFYFPRWFFESAQAWDAFNAELRARVPA